MSNQSPLPRINLHIHSVYSDGRNDLKTLVKKATHLEFKYIAITDHFSNSWKSNIIKTLDSYRKINLYLEKIDAQNKYLSDKEENLHVLKGIEIDLGSSKNYILKLIDPNRLDLILFEYLEAPESIGFVEGLIEEWKLKIVLEKKFPILGLAHFDPSTFIYGNIENLLTFLKKNRIYFEFNSAYSSFYSSKYKDLFFDKLKKYKIPVGIGADSHSVSELKFIEEPLQKIKEYDLEENYKILIDELEQITFF